MNRDMNSASKASVNDPPLQPRSVEKSSWQTKGRLLNEEIRREWHYFSLPLKQTVCQAMPSVYFQIYVHIFSEDQAACGWEKYEKSYMASNSSLEVNRSEVKSSKSPNFSRMHQTCTRNAQDCTEDSQLSHTVWRVLAALRLQLCRPRCCAIIRNLEV